MGDQSKLDTLKSKLASLQEKVEAEEKVEAASVAIDKVRDAFSDAITSAIAGVEKATGESLRSIGLGIWCAYPANGGKDSALMVSGLETGDDGLPAQLKRPSARTTGNGSTAGKSEYVLADGRIFATCLDAVKALGLVVEDAKGKRLDGFAYYHRHDRLPADVKAQITKREKADGTPDAGEVVETPDAGASANGAGEGQAVPAATA